VSLIRLVLMLRLLKVKLLLLSFFDQLQSVNRRWSIGWLLLPSIVFNYANVMSCAVDALFCEGIVPIYVGHL